MLDVTTDDIKEGHKKVLESSNYGQEHKLIQDVLMKYPKNNDMIEIALKISLIDVTNSTNLNRYKSRICVPDLAKIICKIENFDERVRQGDITLVGELARCNGNINLFSFASKYCCYHNTLVYKKDDYSIYDTVIKDNFSKYNENITANKINNWRKKYDYESFHNCIGDFLDSKNIKIPNRRRMFDHYIWYKHRTTDNSEN